MAPFFGCRKIREGRISEGEKFVLYKNFICFGDVTSVLQGEMFFYYPLCLCSITQAREEKLIAASRVTHVCQHEAEEKAESTKASLSVCAKEEQDSLADLLKDAEVTC